MNRIQLLAVVLLLASGLLSACDALPWIDASTPTPTLNPDPLTPTVLPFSFNDRRPYENGLIASERRILGELPGASVYHIDLEIGADLVELSGVQEIRYTNNETGPLTEVYLRLFPVLSDGDTQIERVEVNREAVEPTFELRNSAMRVPLSAPLAPGERAVLKIEYRVEVPTLGGGNYGMFAYEAGVLALAHFYPMIAVFDDEGWNLEIAPPIGDVVYADSSFYIVRVTAPAELTLAASGVEIAREELGERRRFTFAAGPARDFYLAGSERFSVVSERHGDTIVNSYTFPEFEAAAQQTIEFTLNSIDLFTQDVGPYPYTEFDIVSTATDALGIEYPGIVVLTLGMYDPQGPFPGNLLEAVTVHEVAHQWFYSTIGNDQLDEPWLDEAFAQYATLLYYEHVYGPLGYQGYRSSLTDRWSRVDNAEIPIGLPVAAYTGTEYGAIVYGRGPLFIEALAEAMGEPAFSSFLQSYYAVHQWEIATGDSLKATAEAECGCDLTPLFEEWIYPQQ